MIQVIPDTLSTINELQLQGLRLGQLFHILLVRAQQQGVDPLHMPDPYTHSLLLSLLAESIPKETHDTRTTDTTDGGATETDESSAQPTSTDNTSPLQSDNSEEGQHS